MAEQPLTAHDNDGPQHYMRLEQAPKPWLQLLLDDKELLDNQSLQNLMATSWTVCEAVLQCLGKRRIRLGVYVSDVICCLIVRVGTWVCLRVGAYQAPACLVPAAARCTQPWAAS
jgi:hypothetical protein